MVIKMDKKLNSKKECRFCRIINKEGEFEEIDRPIARSHDYIAIVSKGAIVEGWVLVIPGEHAYSMRTFYSDEKFVDFTNEILRKIRQKYNKGCIVFEHGANSCDSLTSCGTNHAHLHIIPYDKSLLDEMKKNNIEWTRCKPSEIKSMAGECEYWFYAEKVADIQEAQGYLHMIEQPESQYFRKLIANKEDCGERFSYKEFQFPRNEKATYDALTR